MLNDKIRPDAWWPGTQAVAGPGIVLLVSKHSWEPGCCGQPRDEHLFVKAQPGKWDRAEWDALEPVATQGGSERREDDDDGNA